MYRTLRLLTVTGVVAAALAGRPLAAQVAGDTSAIMRAAHARVQPGDRLTVKVFREPGMSETVMVDARGDIALPKIGVVNVSNYGILELQDTLRTRFGQFLRNPSIEVVALRRIVVNGEVPKPGVYYVDVGTATLRDAIALAGGITGAGHSKRVSIIRDGERIAVPDWDRSELAIADLRSGDQVMVARRSWLALNTGQVIGGIGVLSSVIFSIISLTR